MKISLDSPSEVNGQRFMNHLLEALDEAGKQRFVARMERVELEAKQLLYHPNERIREIYFPENCVLAMLTVMKDGATIESATVGHEGASWISASFKSPSMPCQTMCAIAGTAFKVPTEVVEREIKQNGQFHNTLSNYAHVLLVQTLRSTACNGLHSLEQRSARWVLMTLDRTGLDRFFITHEFLASLLGAQRPSVSVLVERFVSEGILEISRGYIRVKSRERLERLSCECYWIVREEFEKLGLPRA
jgi:CRP-like cAMP-binding protein